MSKESLLKLIKDCNIRLDFIDDELEKLLDLRNEFENYCNEFFIGDDDVLELVEILNNRTDNIKNKLGGN